MRHCLSPSHFRRMRFGLAVFSLATVLLLPCAPASAAETITWPGTGVLKDVLFDDKWYFYEALAPSAESPSGNRVFMTGGSIGGSEAVSGNVLGGFAHSGDVTNNRVVISDGSIGGAGRVSGWVIGGYAHTGKALDNHLVINGGSIGGEGSSSGCAYGGFAIADNAQRNSVTFNGGSIGGTGDRSGTIYGGRVASTGDAIDNRVVVSGGSLGGTGSFSGWIYGGSAFTGNAINNSVSISGGTLGGTGERSGTVYGGSASTGDAIGNSVSISGGTLGGTGERSGTVYAGRASIGNVIGSSLTISGGTIGGDGAESGTVFGGAATTGNAIGNSVSISGGTLGGAGAASGTVYGGFVTTGNATGNSVTISGGTIGGTGADSGAVFGGFISLGTGKGTHNTVTLLGNPVFGPHATLFGAGAHPSANPSDLRTGNTLNVFTSGIVVKNIGQFQQYNVGLFNGGGAALYLTDSAGTALTDGSGGSVNVPYAASGSLLKAGQTVTLLQSAGTLTQVPAGLSGQTGSVRQGATLLYDYTLGNTGNSITATIDRVRLAPESKAFAENRAATLAFVNLGADLVAGAGLENARAAASKSANIDEKSDPMGLVPFFAMSGSRQRYTTGSDVDVNGLNFMAGLAKVWETPAADLLLGAFIEAGFGTSKTHNRIGGFGTVDGDGDTRTFGGGLLARVDMTESVLRGVYAEVSFRAGKLTGDYDSRDLRDFFGNTASYDPNSTYYGAHAGLGYLWKVTDKASLDLYGKYFWSHQSGQDATLLGDAFNFQGMDSHRTRLGTRFSYAMYENVSTYIGAAWEHEFDGKAHATTYGLNVSAPSLRGSTGMGELGLRWYPTTAQGLSLDVGAQGYTGTRQGVSGSVQLKYMF